MAQGDETVPKADRSTIQIGPYESRPEKASTNWFEEKACIALAASPARDLGVKIRAFSRRLLFTGPLTQPRFTG
jgi:hypothetical protein